MSNILYWKCEHCLQTVGELCLLALMGDAGAKIYPSPTMCNSDKIHNFVEQVKT